MQKKIRLFKRTGGLTGMKWMWVSYSTGKLGTRGLEGYVAPGGLVFRMR